MLSARSNADNIRARAHHPVPNLPPPEITSINPSGKPDVHNRSHDTHSTNIGDTPSNRRLAMKLTLLRRRHILRALDSSSRVRPSSPVTCFFEIKMIFNLITLVLLLPHLFVEATPYTPHLPNPILEPWRWRSFPALEGYELTCSAEDADGNLWFGSREAVIRYDGLHITTFGPDQGLDGESVTAISVSDGEIYCATQQSIFHFDETHWSRIFPLEGDLSWFLSDLAADADGRVWASTAWGLLRLGEGRPTLYTTDKVVQHLSVSLPSISFIAVPPELTSAAQVAYGGLGIQRVGTIVTWVVDSSPADSAGIRIGDRIIGDETTGTTTRLTLARENESKPIEITIGRRPGQGVVRVFELVDLCLTRKGTLWASLSARGMIHFDPSDHSWDIHDEIKEIQAGDRLRIIELANGEIWAVSDDRTRGIGRYVDNTWRVVWLSDRGGIDLNASIVQTRDGTVWIGGYEGILHAYRNEKWEVYRTPDIPIPTTRIIDMVAASDGALWILGNGRVPIRLDYATDRWTTYQGLNYQTEDAQGQTWFLETSGSVIKQKDADWTRFDVNDGVIDTPTGIIPRRRGGVWVVGTHEEQAASARFVEGDWQRELYPELSWGIDGRSAREAANGDLWLGASVDWFPDRGHKGGVLQRSSDQVHHHTPPDALRYVYGIGETNGGRIWIGSRNGVNYYENDEWHRVTDPPELSSGIDVVQSITGGELMIGHRTRGVYRYDGSEWHRNSARNGLADNTVRSLLDARDGTIWAATNKSISRFDGRAWTTPVLPAQLTTGLRGTLHQSADGALWINTASEDWHRRGRPTARTRSPQNAFHTVRHEPDRQPPQTVFTLAVDTVPQPGNATFSWQGSDPWSETEPGNLQYAWRIDDSEWSEYAEHTTRIFQTLDTGDHRFEVRARDRAFNVEPHPAVVHFVVEPPVWQQAWFVLLVLFSSAAVGLQTVRVIRRDRDLRLSNAALTTANTDLETLNQDLTDSNRQLAETRDQLILSEKMASLGNLVAGVAHEVNNPMGAFGSAADTLRRCIDRVGSLIGRASTVDEIRENQQYQRAISLMSDTTDTAVAAGERVTTIVDSLRRFAHLDEAEYQQINLHESLDSIITLKAHDVENRVAINRNYGDIPPVTCYAGELNQALMNVFVNAIESLEGESGTITFTTSEDNGHVVISVADTGRGIAPEDKGRIFDPGFTTKGVGVGVGLGLSTAFRIIQKHDGRIDVESNAGQGSTFHIRIPKTNESVA
jgi:signal transduction histidine kinase/ligand-binding sensor domain-containing protein